MMVIKGVCASQGVAAGTLRFLKKEPLTFGSKRTVHAKREVARFENAVDTVSEQLDAHYKEALKMVGEEGAGIFSAHKIMLRDPDYLDAVIKLIRERRYNAEYAVCVASQRIAGIFASLEDAYMKSRAVDVYDISERLQRTLNLELYTTFALDAPSILAARDITPGEAIQLDKNLVLGFVTAEGSAQSHTSILARSMGLPAVTGAGEELTSNCDGKPAILDGSTGTLYIEPDESTTRLVFGKLDEGKKRRGALNAFRGRPSVTKDGSCTEVFANVNDMTGLDRAIGCDAEGVGLFRSEFLFLGGGGSPSEEEQLAVYKRAVKSMGGKRVIIRTLDLGGDKKADFLGLPYEENPAMGLRGIRFCLERPEIFRTQLRALFRASVFGDMAIMFPMVASLGEVEDALRAALEVKASLLREGVPFNALTEIGLMIETPAAALISGELAETADFFSIGANDLAQYAQAADRQNHRIARYYHTRHPAVLRMIEMTVKAAREAGIKVGICGEIASDLELTETFLRMGVNSLSVSPGMVLPLREKISSLDLNFKKT
jgi:phosphotransferase system enzyme I (PtsI)